MPIVDRLSNFPIASASTSYWQVSAIRVIGGKKGQRQMSYKLRVGLIENRSLSSGTEITQLSSVSYFVYWPFSPRFGFVEPSVPPVIGCARWAWRLVCFQKKVSEEGRWVHVCIHLTAWVNGQKPCVYHARPTRKDTFRLRRWKLAVFTKKCNSYATATESPKTMCTTNTEQSHWKLRVQNATMPKQKVRMPKKGSWLNVMRVVSVSVANDRVINCHNSESNENKIGKNKVAHWTSEVRLVEVRIVKDHVTWINLLFFTFGNEDV